MGHQRRQGTPHRKHLPQICHHQLSEWACLGKQPHKAQERGRNQKQAHNYTDNNEKTFLLSGHFSLVLLTCRPVELKEVCTDLLKTCFPLHLFQHFTDIVLFLRENLQSSLPAFHMDPNVGASLHFQVIENGRTLSQKLGSSTHTLPQKTHQLTSPFGKEDSATQLRSQSKQAPCSYWGSPCCVISYEDSLAHLPANNMYPQKSYDMPPYWKASLGDYCLGACWKHRTDQKLIGNWKV